jgi:hypothetical protein
MYSIIEEVWGEVRIRITSAPPRYFASTGGRFNLAVTLKCSEAGKWTSDIHLRARCQCQELLNLLKSRKFDEDAYIL